MRMCSVAYPMSVLRIARFSSAMLKSCDSQVSVSDSAMDSFVIKGKKNKFRNGRVFLWGPHGSGKTTWARENFDCVELEYDAPEEFIDRLNPFVWLLVDNEDCKDIPDRDRTIYIAIKDRCVASDITKIEFKDREREHHGTQDVFIDPNEHIIKNITTKRDSYIDMIDSCYGEHGNCIGIIHENLINSTLDIHTIANVLDSMSKAINIDDIMYIGNWDLFKFYNVFAYVDTCSMIQGTVTDVKPATMWTKFLNECMKRKKIKESRKNTDVLWLLKEYAAKGENPEKLSSSEIDLLKYTDFYGKLKPRVTQRLKKLSQQKEKT